MKFKSCKTCVMDNSDPLIFFNNKGICNYCEEHKKLKHLYTFSVSEEKENLNKIKLKINKSKKGKYDCLLGLSGGVDSSYLAYLANEIGLNPLCVHFDNGWNSEIAVKNINTIVKKFDYDLITYVINWDEFKDLQKSFIKANVIDLEMLSDHAIFASLFKIRKDYNLKYVLSGTNFATEFGLPMSWIWSKMDWKNIKSIHKRFGTTKLKTFPRMSGLKWALIQKFGFGGEFIELLNMINFRKDKAIKKLNELGWQNYGGKHYESVITKFYQVYILPKKFNVDKRKFHLSSLIRNNEITKNEAESILINNPLENKNFDFEKDYFLKKLDISESEFNEYINSPGINHDFYGSDRSFMKFLKRISKIIGFSK